MSHPYRTTAERPLGSRWGATWGARWYVRLFVRRSREGREAVRLEHVWFTRTTTRTRFRCEPDGAQLAKEARCLERIRIDCGFLYEARCTCGEHARVVRDDGRTVWRSRPAPTPPHHLGRPIDA